MPELARARATAAKDAGRDRRAKAPAPVDPAPELPVARVLVDVPLAHLDRPFDYLVPAKLHDQVAPGSRVKVRFAGQDVDGFVLERVDAQRPRGPARRRCAARSAPSRCCRPAVARLSELVAARYAGTRSDVLRLAVPARHATTEKQASPAGAGGDARPRRRGDGLGGRTTAARRSCAGWPRGQTPRAVWSALPGGAWPDAAGAGRGRDPRLRAAACCSACPTTRTSPGSTRR